MITPRGFTIATAMIGLIVPALLANPRLREASARMVSPRQDDDEELAYQLELGKRAFEGNCLMCHTEAMVSQQRMSSPAWTAEVEKMIGWGAPVPPEDKSRLIAFLASRYPEDKPAAPPERMSPEEVMALDRVEEPPFPQAGNINAGSELYKTHCANCHGANALGGDLGTNLVEKPVLLREAEFHSILREGRRRMPGFSKVLTPSQQEDLLAWLRAQRVETQGF